MKKSTLRGYDEDDARKPPSGPRSMRNSSSPARPVQNQERNFADHVHDTQRGSTSRYDNKMMSRNRARLQRDDLAMEKADGADFSIAGAAPSPRLLPVTRGHSQTSVSYEEASFPSEPFNSNVPPHARDARDSAKNVQPGAVRVGGARQASFSSYGTDIPFQERGSMDAPQPEGSAIAAEVVEPQVDVEAQVDARMRAAADDIAERVRRTLIDNAAHADVLEQEQPEPPPRGEKRWIHRAILGSLLMVVIATVIALVVVFATRKSGGGTSSTETEGPTPVVSGVPSPQTNPTFAPAASFTPTRTSTTQSPTAPPVERAPTTRLSSLQDVLTPIVGEIFGDSSSSEYRALDWLANGDPAELPVETTAVDTFKKRFILTAFYFSTGGESWANQYNFLSADDVCNWHVGSAGVTCDEDSYISLVLEENSLAGSLPEVLTRLEELEKLDVGTNMIAGSLPDGIGNLRRLETLDVASNPLTGSIPSSLFNIRNLEKITILDNDLSGTLPETIGNASSLESLVISFNSALTGTIPSSISNLASLTAVAITHNRISGTIPDLGKSRGLILVLLDSNQGLTGSIPQSMGSLPKLRYFGASVNALNGTIPSFAGNGGTLEELWLYNNLLSGASEFFETIAPRSLTNIRLSNNLIAHAFPATSIGKFTNLRNVDISGNMFSGSLPTEVGLLSMQGFKGIIQTEGSFDVYDNLLTGTLPTELGRLVKADNIDLGENQFAGTIPSHLGSCTTLSKLSMAFNLLEGTVPTDIASLPILDEFRVQGNDGLTGDFDSTFCSRQTPFGYLSSDCLRDDVTCSCCNYCCSGSNPTSCEDLR